MRRLDALGLNRGSTGNLSLRCDREVRNPETGAATGPGMLITPTGMPPEALQPQDMVWMRLADAHTEGAWQPSTEWHFHRAVYQARPDVQAVVHTHAANATALACLRRPLPAFHYMVAVCGGDSVPCVRYEMFGTDALSQAVAAALLDRDACLMANHGIVTTGASLPQAMKVMLEIESLCGVYLQALAVGEPALLSKHQMAEVIDRFKSYGRAARSD